MTITIDGSPVPKERPRVRTGHAYTPKRTRQYEQRVRAAYQDLPEDEKTCYPAGVPVRMIVKAYFPIAKSNSKRIKEDKRDGTLKPTRRPDGDNIEKIVMDALNGLAYDDDAQITDLRVIKRYSDTPRVEVTIAEDK